MLDWIEDEANRYYLQYKDFDGHVRYYPRKPPLDNEPINMPRPQKDALKDEPNVFEEWEALYPHSPYYIGYPPQASTPFPIGESGTVDSPRWITTRRK